MLRDHDERGMEQLWQKKLAQVALALIAERLGITTQEVERMAGDE